MRFFIFFAVFVLSTFNTGCGFAEQLYVKGCCCYKSSCSASYDFDGQWPAAELKKCWAKLNMPVHLVRVKKSGDETYFYNFYKSYCELFSKHIKRKIELDKTCEGKALKQKEIPYYYPSLFEERYEYLEKAYQVMHEWEIVNRTFAYDNKICTPELYCPDRSHAGYGKDIQTIHNRFNKFKAERTQINSQTDELLRKVFEFCSKRHISLRSYYEHGFLQFRRGDYLNSMNTSKNLVEYSLEYDDHQYLTADTFLRLGITCSMSLEYAQSIEALAHAIEKDPENAEIYLQRAIAYLELGNFEAAISDYIRSGREFSFELPDDPYKIEFAKGFMGGAYSGLRDGASEIPASLWHTVRGTGQLLWAGVQDPIGVSKDLINSVEEMISFLVAHDLATLSKIIAPEVYELVTQWKTLDSYKRGEKAGFVLGKYGISIFSSYGGVKGVQLFRQLRNANALCTLKTITSSPKNKAAVINATEQLAAQRQQFFAKATLHMDRQGKHIVGHRNYSAALEKSIFTHSDPTALLAEHAGKGIPFNKKKFGEAGYQEIVDFKEVIGIYINPEAKISGFSTTRGKIHYDKNGGAHIVPFTPLE